MKLLSIILSILLLTTPAHSLSLKPIKDRSKDLNRVIEDLGGRVPEEEADQTDHALNIKIINWIMVEMAGKRHISVKDVYRFARRKRPNVEASLIEKAINDTGYHRRFGRIYNFPDPFGARLAFPLKHGDILAGTDLLERFKVASKNTHVIYISGFFETAAYTFKNVVKDIDPNDIVLFYWDLYDSTEDSKHFGLAVDRKINFMRSIAYNPENFMHMRLGSRALLIRMKEFRESKELLLSYISIGKHEDTDHTLSYRTLRGRGYMEQIFFNLEIFIKRKYDGWELQARPTHPKMNEFLSTFNSTTRGTWKINGGRLTRDEYLNLAQLITLYVSTRLKYDHPFITDVYKRFQGVNPNFIDMVIDGQFELKEDMIMGWLKSMGSLDSIIDEWLLTMENTGRAA